MKTCANKIKYILCIVMKEVNYLITDLDDTIWDWLSMWYNSFEPYLRRIAKETGVNINQLKQDFKRLHQNYGTTEMSFAYRELQHIQPEHYAFFENVSQANERNILHEYHSNKKHNLFAYDGVIDTLKRIKDSGTKIVAFTESKVFFTKYRIKHLALDGIIDTIYAPMGSNLPDSVTTFYPESYWEPDKSVFKVLPKDTRKPNMEILNMIISADGADKDKAIYIGDKLDRDVYMAQQAGITSVYAKYGHVIDDEAYDLLRKVTHWTDEDVEREINFKKAYLEIAPPNYTIDNFTELFDHFKFSKFA